MFDRECIGCQYLFTCTGKPEEVKKCIASCYINSLKDDEWEYEYPEENEEEVLQKGEDE